MVLMYDLGEFGALTWMANHFGWQPVGSGVESSQLGHHPRDRKGHWPVLGYVGIANSKVSFKVYLSTPSYWLGFNFSIAPLAPTWSPEHVISKSNITTHANMDHCITWHLTNFCKYISHSHAELQDFLQSNVSLVWLCGVLVCSNHF